MSDYQKHRDMANGLLNRIDNFSTTPTDVATLLMAAAQVHATLALAAATEAACRKEDES